MCTSAARNAFALRTIEPMFMSCCQFSIATWNGCRCPSRSATIASIASSGTRRRRCGCRRSRAAPGRSAGRPARPPARPATARPHVSTLDRAPQARRGSRRSPAQATRRARGRRCAPRRTSSPEPVLRPAHPLPRCTRPTQHELGYFGRPKRAIRFRCAEKCRGRRRPPHPRAALHRPARVADRACPRRGRRLPRPRQRREQHDRRRQVRLPAGVGGRARQRHGVAHPVPLGQARDRHRQEPARDPGPPHPQSAGRAAPTGCRPSSSRWRPTSPRSSAVRSR